MTRFGSHYIETLLEAQRRLFEMIFPGNIGDELVDNFVAVITRMARRRQSKRWAEKIKQYVEQVMKEEHE